MLIPRPEEMRRKGHQVTKQVTRSSHSTASHPTGRRSSEDQRRGASRAGVSVALEVRHSGAGGGSNPRQRLVCNALEVSYDPV